MQVNIKHGAKSLPLTTSAQNGGQLKAEIEAATGVPQGRMKVMIKGKLLRDDVSLDALGIQQNQVITVIGSATSLPQAPVEIPKFVEDMDQHELAKNSDVPSGLVNLGQTCYLNSSLQVLRAMPELRSSLTSAGLTRSTPNSRLSNSISGTLDSLDNSAVAVPPFLLLNDLRTVNPQFAETDRSGGFAQQDADEAWTQLISNMRSNLGSGSANDPLEKLMGIDLVTHPEEPATTSSEQLLKLECNISVSTNFMMSGILESLNQQVEKHSETLGRTALYNSKARLSSAPQYLAVHMVRFYWRRDIQKKAKIMRKVKFPLQLDVTDMMTDELRSTIQPVTNFVREELKDRDDRARVLKRTSRTQEEDKKEETRIREEKSGKVAELVNAKQELKDLGNPSGIYELVGMVTHKGPSADSGHYIGWTRKEDKGAFAPSGEEEWYKFDDDKVSTVNAEKILSMDGGGEDSVAYILLYKAVSL